ncbi:uncharacterized protein CLUP02_10882 [Colletotrichum lupini]|uniref:Uncharacterized protein n=1 Tax=Colletotrichum lupini TaxID=145971 RepID=A0A9Q8WJZ2_9PEZI|nr:uncharacterized protein CLUP02_10882 [Colletotrichum lupini]UQC85385.1 hypothetical protein CLUP02_10882 [Colletotrichum lupini]
MSEAFPLQVLRASYLFPTEVHRNELQASIGGLNVHSQAHASSSANIHHPEPLRVSLQFQISQFHVNPPMSNCKYFCTKVRSMSKGTKTISPSFNVFFTLRHGSGYLLAPLPQVVAFRNNAFFPALNSCSSPSRCEVWQRIRGVARAHGLRPEGPSAVSRLRDAKFDPASSWLERREKAQVYNQKTHQWWIGKDLSGCVLNPSLIVIVVTEEDEASVLGCEGNSINLSLDLQDLVLGLSVF